MERILANVREKSPLVHCITNYVTVNDVANILLACGASPVMADEEEDAQDIVAIADGLVINIGTLNRRTINSMGQAGKRANELKRPVVLDPVGAGASNLRTKTTFQLLEEIRFAVIRGNISEIKTIAQGAGSTRGVDADLKDAITEKNLERIVPWLKELSNRLGAIIAITGAIDVVADPQVAYVIRNGHPLMSRITGTGCMLTALIGPFVAANQMKLSGPLPTAVAAMGLCGELAYQMTVRHGTGTGSFRTYLIDTMSQLDGKTLRGGVRVETR